MRLHKHIASATEGVDGASLPPSRIQGLLTKLGKFVALTLFVLLLGLMILAAGFLSVETRLPVPFPEKLPSWISTTLLGEDGSLSVRGDITIKTGMQPGIELHQLDFDVTSEYGQAKGSITSFQSSLSLKKAWGGMLKFSLIAKGFSSCLRPNIDNLAALAPPKDLYNLVNRLRPEHIDAQDISIDISENCNATSPILQVTSANLNSNNGDSPAITARGQLAHLPWSIDSSLPHKSNTLPTLHGKLGAMTWSLTPEYDPSGAPSSAVFNVHSQELYEALKITPLPFKAFGPFAMQLRGSLLSNSIQWQLTELNIADSHWQGQGTVSLSGDKPHLMTGLSSETLNLRKLLDWVGQSIDLSKLSLAKLSRGALQLIEKSNGEFTIEVRQVDYDSLLVKEKTALNIHWLDSTLSLAGSQSIQEKAFHVSGQGEFIQDVFSWRTAVTIPPLDVQPFLPPSELLQLRGSTGPTTINGQLKINAQTGELNAATGQLHLPDSSVTLATNLLPHTYSLASVNVSATPDEHLLVEVHGEAMAQPSTLNLKVDRWLALLQQSTSPGELNASLGNIRLHSVFDIATSHSEANANGTFAIATQAAPTPTASSALDGEGKFSWKNNQLQLHVDSIKKGQSLGEADFVVVPFAEPTSVSGDIRLKTLYLEDFGISMAKLTSTDNIAKIPGKVDDLLATWIAPARQLLQRTQGQVRLSIDEINLDKMQASMKIASQFGHGKVDILPSKIYGVRGGTINFSAALDLSDEHLMAISTRARGKDIYYHYDHPTIKKISGHLNTDVDLNTKAAPKETELLSALRGNISFMSQPEFGEFMLFDLWGGGFIQTLAQSVGAIEKSKINCSAGLLTFADGLLKINPVIIDSTRVRVNATLAANLTNGEIEGYAKPEPKDPALLRNWLPMVVSGTLAEPFVKPQKGAGIVTAARWLYAIPAYVVDLATVHHMAEDGLPDCRKIFEYQTQATKTDNKTAPP